MDPILRKFPQVGGSLVLLDMFSTLLRPFPHSHPLSCATDANKVADRLANEGVSSQEEDILIDGQILPAPPLLLQCLEIAHRDCPPQMG
jgi:hypothetical protein